MKTILYIKTMANEKYDVVIIGGGFYGLRMAQFMKEELGAKKVLIIEKEKDVMQRASYNNQARVHNGYHYPRSILTALRSRVNLPVFVKEYDEAVSKDFDMYYAIARNFSQVSAIQFERFFERIKAEISRAPDMHYYFNRQHIEEVFSVKEYVFNSSKLKKILLDKLSFLGVGINTKEAVRNIEKSGDNIIINTDRNRYAARYVINSTYSSINLINKASGLPIISLKHELTEMCLVKVPRELDNMAVTVMCGPFFSLMPFPAQNLYTLSHVRYTPHSESLDAEGSAADLHKYLEKAQKVTNFPRMYADIVRYMPLAKGIEYTGKSLWEIKTVLQESETDDSRPILYRKNHGDLKNYICVMGGKLDNIYDVFRELRETYEKA